MKLLLALSITLVSSCAALSPAPSSPPPENSTQAGHAPTPFSADDLRRSFPDGTQLRFELGSIDAEPQVQILSFSNPSDAGVEVQVELVDPDGTVVVSSPVETAMWEELQSHASFPEADVTLTREPHETRLGVAECWHYAVRSVQNERTLVTHYWFDIERPGPPVDFTMEFDGVLSYRMEMVSDTR